MVGSSRTLEASDARFVGGPTPVLWYGDAHPNNPIGIHGAGMEVASSASQTLKRVHLELGGKAPVIVFDDVDIASAAESKGFICRAISACRLPGKIATRPPSGGGGGRWSRPCHAHRCHRFQCSLWQ